MPTIEIASIGAKKLGLKQSNFEIAIIEEKTLVSHRDLFYDFLVKHEGIIVHIGNPNLKGENNHGFFAGMIIDWEFEPEEIEIYNSSIGESNSDQHIRFKFLPNYRPEIAKIINAGIQNSPIKKLFFLTDYQFGPSTAVFKELKLTDFWKRHDNEGLDWNTLYILQT